MPGGREVAMDSVSGAIFVGTSDVTGPESFCVAVFVRGRQLGSNGAGFFASSVRVHYNGGSSLLNQGPVAQLGARLNGIQEVTGSIPVRSTILSFSVSISRK